MTPEMLYKDAIEAKEQKSYGMSLFFPKGYKKPKGFPIGELMCETLQGRVYSYKPDKVIEWLNKNGIIK
jgi:hypothetical protein